ncbi:MAG: hypothetical protein K2F76_09950 [Duncaniella dubosii]|nr:hypothetical protein [Duncaniella dubosii]
MLRKKVKVLQAGTVIDLTARSIATCAIVNELPEQFAHYLHALGESSHIFGDLAHGENGHIEPRFRRD